MSFTLIKNFCSLTNLPKDPLLDRVWTHINYHTNFQAVSLNQLFFYYVMTLLVLFDNNLLLFDDNQSASSVLPERNKY